MAVGGVVIIVGAVIACTSNTVAQITVGRFVLGSGIAIMTVGAPAYAIEIAPAHWRGRCVGEHQSSLPQAAWSRPLTDYVPIQASTTVVGSAAPSPRPLSPSAPVISTATGHGEFPCCCSASPVSLFFARSSSCQSPRVSRWPMARRRKPSPSWSSTTAMETHRPVWSCLRSKR